MELILGGRKLATLLDTGARPSVIDSKTLEKLQFKCKLVPYKSRVYGIGKDPVNVCGFVDVPI